MEKPSRFRFKHIATRTIHSDKMNGKEFFQREEIETILKESSGDLIQISLPYSTNKATLCASFFVQENKSVEEFRQETLEYELKQKNRSTKDLLHSRQIAYQQLNKNNNKTHELEVAKMRLAEFVGNDKIPSAKKKTLVETWTNKVALLEATIDPVDMEFLVQLRDQIKKLQEDLELQNEILNLNAKNCEVVEPQPPQCSACRGLASLSDSWYDD